MKEPKTRMREGIVIGTAELQDGLKRKELNTTMLMIPEYIGFTEVFDGTGRLYVFSTKEAADYALRESKHIGFRSAGRVDGAIYISNADLNRPHINKYRGYDFMREYYK